MENKSVTFCPNCLKRVEAKEYFSKGGMSDWRADTPGSTIACSKCGYEGFPLQATEKEYAKALKEREREDKEPKVTFCPNCFKPVEAKEHFSGYLGAVYAGGSVLMGATTDIECSKCGYEGLPIQATMREYEKLIKEKKK